ncbi:MAG: prepilin-type N-terminal cleavage/methylation domain-containing protein [Ruminiclostridium sp.]
MIKFFQKLKAKKGFTLVELIVVIAIIGVLAAILIPTMLGYVTSSRVTSADSTAASIEDCIDTFLTQCDTNGYGMKQSSTAQCLITGSVDNTGSWTLVLSDASAFKSNTTYTWQASPNSHVANDSKQNITDPAELMTIELASLFPDMKNACFEASLVGGDCAAVWYTADTDTVGNVTDLATGANLTQGKWTASTFAWDTHTAGISADGYTVGTAPKLLLA